MRVYKRIAALHNAWLADGKENTLKALADCLGSAFDLSSCGPYGIRTMDLRLSCPEMLAFPVMHASTGRVCILVVTPSLVTDIKVHCAHNHPSLTDEKLQEIIGCFEAALRASTPKRSRH